MAMTIILIFLLVWMTTQLVATIVWDTICHFKKTCTWVRCPRRANYEGKMTWASFFFEDGCKKCPMTPEERADFEKKLSVIFGDEKIFPDSEDNAEEK